MAEEAISNIKLTANVKIYEHPKDFTYQDFQKLSDEEKQKSLRYEGKNLVVNAGLNQVIALIIASSTTAWTHCGVGSNSTAVTATDTDLNTSIVRVAVTNAYQASNIAHFDTFFSSSQGTGTWLETGIFTAISAGIMLCRKIISSFVKSTSNTATVAWTITLTAT